MGERSVALYSAAIFQLVRRSVSQPFLNLRGIQECMKLGELGRDFGAFPFQICDGFRLAVHRFHFDLGNKLVIVPVIEPFQFRRIHQGCQRARTAVILLLGQSPQGFLRFVG